MPLRRHVLVLAGLLIAVLVPAGSAGLADEGPVTRIAGADRIETAIALSESSFDTAETAVVASSAGFADALAAGPLAAAAGAPVLLNPPGQLDDRVRGELDRLGVSRVFLMGGEAAQSAQVEQELEATGVTVERIAGSDRFATAVAAAAETRQTAGGTNRVVLALGDHPVQERAWPDALGAGVLAAQRGEALLLVLPDRLPAATRQFLSNQEIERVTLVGGPAAIGSAVVDELTDLGIAARRIAGDDRYATAAAVADEILGEGLGTASQILVASGQRFPDALAAGPVAAARDGVLVLTHGRDLDYSGATASWLRAISPDATPTVLVAGGSAVVAPPIEGQIAAALEGLAGLRLGTQEVGPGLSTPLGMVQPPGEDRLFVFQRGGEILILDGDTVTGSFLDISDRTRTDGERGLLGLAFHPQYASNGRFFVHYSHASDGDTILAEYRRSSRNQASRSEIRLQRIDQPFSNHNGGSLHFGPDGMLYLALGDGGSGGDPENNGQDPTTPLGAMLRYDVSTPGQVRAPGSNPFVGRTGDDRIWHYGLRNPYRTTFDPVTGELYIADVGQSEWEEINVVSGAQGGLNFGWNTTEGPDCYDASSCDRQGFTSPVEWYGHDSGRCSITGGHVYRGDIGRLRGHYFYGDFCSGEVWSFRFVDGEVTEQKDWSDQVGGNGNIFSFAQDTAGEVYVLTSSRILRIVAG